MANLAVCRGTALALGIHSRIDAAVERILARLPHGNTYLDRNMIGAVAGRGKIALRK
jgi:RHH-type proline utilization regulon transcriptional repressor/proline dehydrogenase/delta 1-pyrroline-5-carboxylate dehydrogenase